jgi:hypothetical protein
LKITVKLAKDPADYAVNNPNIKIGMLLEAKAGDVIWYFKTDDNKGSVSINPQEIGICKYKEILVVTVKDALGILGYGSAEKIESERSLVHPRNQRRERREKEEVQKLKAQDGS